MFLLLLEIYHIICFWSRLCLFGISLFSLALVTISFFILFCISSFMLDVFSPFASYVLCPFVWVTYLALPRCTVLLMKKIGEHVFGRK